MGNTLLTLRQRGTRIALITAAVAAFGPLAVAPASASSATAAVATETVAAETVVTAYAVSGTVTGTSSTGTGPLAGVSVSVSASSGTPVTHSGTTDADGHYSLTGIPSGKVYVSFDYENGFDTGLAYSTGRPEAHTINNGDIVVDKTLVRRGSISGTVTKKIDGVVTPAANAYVSVTDSRAGHYDIDTTAFGTTDAQGRYATSGLVAGTYTVAFGERASGTSLAPIYYGNELDRATATVVTVETEAATRGIDAEMFALGVAPVTDLSAVSLAGEFAAGETLTAVASSATAGAVFTYRWSSGYRQTQTIGKTYSVVEGDLGGDVRVFVTASAPHNLPTSGAASTSDPAPTEPPASTEPPAPTEPPASPDTETPAPTTSATPTSAPVLVETGSTTGAPARTEAKIFPDTASGPAATSFVAGGTIPITMSGFQPFEVVEIWLYSTPMLLGTLTADVDGVISGSFTVPSGTPAGTHHVVLFDEAGIQYTSVDLTVAASVSQLAATGVSANPLWFALAIMMLGGVVVLFARGRRFANGSSK